MTPEEVEFVRRALKAKPDNRPEEYRLIDGQARLLVKLSSVSPEKYARFAEGEAISLTPEEQQRMK